MGKELHFKMASKVQRQDYRAVLAPYWLIYNKNHIKSDWPTVRDHAPIYHWFSGSQALQKAKCCHSSLPHLPEKKSVKTSLK